MLKQSLGPPRFGSCFDLNLNPCLSRHFRILFLTDANGYFDLRLASKAHVWPLRAHVEVELNLLADFFSNLPAGRFSFVFFYLLCPFRDMCDEASRLKAQVASLEAEAIFAAEELDRARAELAVLRAEKIIDETLDANTLRHDNELLANGLREQMMESDALMRAFQKRVEAFDAIVEEKNRLLSENDSLEVRLLQLQLLLADLEKRLPVGAPCPTTPVRSNLKKRRVEETEVIVGEVD